MFNYFFITNLLMLLSLVMVLICEVFLTHQPKHNFYKTYFTELKLILVLISVYVQTTYVFNIKALFLLISFCMLFFKYTVSLISNILLMHILLFSFFFTNTNIINLFLEFELIFLFFSTIPILIRGMIHRIVLMQLIISFFKWSLPTTLIGVFVVKYTLLTLGSCDINLLVYNRFFTCILFSYFLLKVTVWPLVAYKNKLYLGLSQSALVYFNVQYFFLLQLLTLGTLTSLKTLGNGSWTLYILILVNIYSVKNIRNVGSLDSFLLLTSYLTYINYLYLVV